MTRAAFTSGSLNDLDEIAALIKTQLGRQPNLPYMTDCLSNYPSVVVRQNGEMLGYAYGRRFAPDILEVSNILIVKDIRSHGLGSQLLGAFEKAAQAAGWKSLILVNSTLYGGKDKRPATNFYERNGYRLVHTTG